jgi:hypothetical protein
VSSGTRRRVGLLVPAPDGTASAWGLPRRLAAHARAAGTTLVPLVGGGPPSGEAVVLLVAQYGPALAAESAEVLGSDPTPWGDRPLGLVGYGAIERARDALADARDLLAAAGHPAVAPSLGVNVAAFRGAGDLTAFEVLGWHALLDALLDRADDLGRADAPAPDV